MGFQEQMVDHVLQGAVDFHIHSHMSPAYHWDLVNIGQRFMNIGMRAAVVKNLYGSSHEQCNIANKLLEQEMLYAVLVLGKHNGGFQKTPVEQFVNFGGNNKIIEMPVFDAARHLTFFGQPAHEGLSAFDGDIPSGDLEEILQIIAQNDIILKTGHLDPQETIDLISLAREAGIEKIVVTHATGPPVMASVRQQEKMAELGAVIEHCVGKFLPVSVLRSTQKVPSPDLKQNIGDLEYLAQSIRSVGPQNCVLGTDSGQMYRPYPHELFKYFLHLLIELGFSCEEIRTMACDNPGRLLNINDH